MCLRLPDSRPRRISTEIRNVTPSHVEATKPSRGLYVASHRTTPVKVRLSIENRRVSRGNLGRPITLEQRRSCLRCRCDAETASQEALGVGHEDGTSCWFCCQLVSHLLPYPHTFRSGLGPNLHETYESDTSLLKPSRDPSFRTSDKSNGSPFSLHALSQPSFSQNPPHTHSSPAPLVGPRNHHPE